ncbi:MAG TPA: aminodeoxychorismate lyase [Methylothermaceae bacterium]|nr:aminodeoxychorismate lyase [Methylothermaceae bacterium]
MTGPVWINGRQERCIDVSDRGFQYGDGLFETFLIKDRTPQLWQQHLARLRRGCERLAIPMPAASMLHEEALVACSGMEAGVLKLQLTRGRGGRGYRVPQPMEPTRVISCHPLPPTLSEHRHNGVAIRLCRTRLGINPALAGIKHCNRLEQILARLEWNDPAVYEGLMCDSEGFLVEATMTNLFWVRDGAILTPCVDRCGVAGVARDWVIDKLRSWGERVQVVREKPEILLQAEEVFLTNSVIGIVPVVSWQPHRHWSVGPITRRLQAAWLS